MEREVLLRAAPHLIWPLSFVLRHDRTLRPVWMIRLGLFLYDYLGGRRTLPASRRHDLTQGVLGAPPRSGVTTGFSYSDCRVQDDRFVVPNDTAARARGAELGTRNRCAGVRCRKDRGGDERR